MGSGGFGLVQQPGSYYAEHIVGGVILALNPDLGSDDLALSYGILLVGDLLGDLSAICDQVSRNSLEPVT
jgi:hypothetical protein